ncbi:MAG TPA: alpha/beta hydrolase [Hymenobacter sp.]
MLPASTLLSLPEGPAIAVYDTGGTGPAIVLLPGNSLSVEATYGALVAELALAGYRLVAFDWPGCGASPWNPAWYGPARLRQALALAFAALAVPACVVVGHSLGGHLALGALPELPQVRGLLLSGAPPLGSAADFVAAFRPDPRMALMYQAGLTADELAQLVPAVLRSGAPAAEQALITQALRQSDPAFRTVLGAEVAAGNLLDEQAVLRATAVPVAFAHGQADALVNGAYLETLAAPSRWGAPVHVLAGAGHTPMLEAPAAFAALLAAFGRGVLG